MKKIKLLPTIIVSLFISQSYAADWSYSEPQNWATLAPEYALCGNGKNQSPVNIDSKKTETMKPSGIKLNYGMTLPETITNTGNLIQVKTRGWAKLNADGTEFELKSIDFHIPSEHTIDGNHFPMEVQFMHKSKDNQIAIVSRMAAPGRPDRTLHKLMEKLPMQVGQTARLAPNALKNIEMKKKEGNFYRYNGSLTTPPCGEGVRWYIMRKPMSFSKEQYETLKKAVTKDNNRPAQALNARIILE